MPAILDCKLDRRWNIILSCDCNGATVARLAAATVTVKRLSKPSRSRHPAQCCIRHLRRRVDPEQVAEVPGGTGRCTETATVRGYSGNGGAKRGSGGTRPRLDAQAASEAITSVEEAQNIAVVAFGCQHTELRSELSA
jgi:hypothetical protein